MKICINGVIRDMTPEEIAEMEGANARYEAEEKHRPLTIGEVSEMLVRKQINTLSADDAVAIRMKDYYPPWESGKAYTIANGCPVGYKVTRNGRLWKLRQEHTSQDNWAPGETGTESLWRKSANPTTARSTIRSPTTATWNWKTASITRRAMCCISAPAILGIRFIIRWRSWWEFMWR